MGGQPVEIVGEIDEFVACVAKPHLSCQIPQDFSHAPVFLRFRGRRKILDHVDFPPNRPNRVENAVEGIEFLPRAPECGSGLDTAKAAPASAIGIRLPTLAESDPNRRARPSAASRRRRRSAGGPVVNRRAEPLRTRLAHHDDVLLSAAPGHRHNACQVSNCLVIIPVRLPLPAIRFLNLSLRSTPHGETLRRHRRSATPMARSATLRKAAWANKPAKLRQKDRDARWTVKYTKAKPSKEGMPPVDLAVPAFGYKNHLGIDRRHGLIRTWTVTDAARHDGALLPELIDKNNTASQVWADTAYRSQANEKFLAARLLRSQVHRKNPKGKPMPRRTARANARKSAVRSAVEHVFARQKGQWACSSAPSASPERKPRSA